MVVEFLGWHSQEETIQLLSEADVLYCPYWFDSAFEEESRLSFPSKLTTYLAAGRPVLFHGPAYASPAVFLKERGAGECCFSLDTDSIIASLTKLANDEAFYKETTFNGTNAFMECLTMLVLQKNFLEFLNRACS
jgi:glycosyltransferase involved in cell wall biosynthesis